MLWRDVPIAVEHGDIMRIGIRNMEDYSLLKTAKNREGANLSRAEQNRFFLTFDEPQLALYGPAGWQ
jgi:hypothetical protein